MRMRTYRFGPLAGFTVLSLLGFMFFTICLGLVWLYSEAVDVYVNEKFKLTGLEDFIVFIILTTLNAIAFLITFVQLALSKPTSKKVLIPIVLVTISAFAILIALDFYLEVQLTHITPKETFTMSPDGKQTKKGKGRLKMGYFVIYASLCIVAGFIYLAYKDLEEFLETQQNRNETPEIVISHIT